MSMNEKIMESYNYLPSFGVATACVYTTERCASAAGLCNAKETHPNYMGMEEKRKAVTLYAHTHTLRAQQQADQWKSRFGCDPTALSVL